MLSETIVYESFFMDSISCDWNSWITSKPSHSVILVGWFKCLGIFFKKNSVTLWLKVFLAKAKINYGLGDSMINCADTQER